MGFMCIVFSNGSMRYVGVKVGDVGTTEQLPEQ